VATIAHAAGEKGMIGGQVVDILSQGSPLEEEMLDYLITNKTARLIMAPVLGAGILSGLDPDQLKDLERAAFLMGYSFQLRDDLLDLTGDQAVTGKASNRDEVLGKNTYPSCHGIEKTEKDIDAFLEEATTILRNMSEYDWSFMIELIQELKKREK
jgi:geranylgeranyl diphosphate synthase type II